MTAPHPTTAAGLDDLVTHVTADDLAQELRSDVQEGLTASPKTLPPKWFYDSRGSELFEDITRLEEYYPTRREREVLEARAAEAAALTQADTLVELGSGSSEKTRVLLDALQAQGTLRRFVPVDVSGEFLHDAARQVAQEYPSLQVAPVAADIERHLHLLPTEGRRLVVLLGGTIGNLLPSARAAFLQALAATLRPGDAMLLGTDLVKDPARLVAAYDDALGVTAAFNTNVLHVLRRELDADCDPEAFEHVARWMPAEARVEMRLRARSPQRVQLRGLDLTVHVAAGEEIRTEVSCKFTEERVRAELAEAGLRTERWWTDAAGDYGVSLSVPA